MNDIDLSETKPGGEWDSGNGWTPIGEKSGGLFHGILDGNGYKIVNMTCYGTENKSYGGLFRSIGSGDVKNLGLENIDIDGKNFFGSWGGIATTSIGKIENCYVTGKIQGCGDIGGIVAHLQDYGRVTNCYTDIQISDYSDYQSNIGGIAGLVGGYAGDPFVKNCYSVGTIDATRKTDLNESDIDPVIGYERYFYSDNLYYLNQPELTEADSSKDSNGNKLTKAQMKSPKCFTGFDFENTWIVDKNSSYPYPQLRNCMQVRTESIELLSAPDKLNYTTADKQLDLTGSELKINYEDNYEVTVPLDESMLSYNMKEGKQTVTIKYNNCKTSFEISVKEAKESLKVLSKKQTLKIGDTYTFKVKYVGQGKVQYTSSNSKILSIDKNTGKVKARKAGKVTVTIKAGKITKKLSVNVKK